MYRKTDQQRKNEKKKRKNAAQATQSESRVRLV